MENERLDRVLEIFYRLICRRAWDIVKSVITVEVNYGRGIIMYLLSQGSWVKVLEPKPLTEDMWRDRIDEKLLLGGLYYGFV